MESWVSFGWVRRAVALAALLIGCAPGDNRAEIERAASALGLRREPASREILTRYAYLAAVDPEKPMRVTHLLEGTYRGRRVVVFEARSDSAFASRQVKRSFYLTELPAALPQVYVVRFSFGLRPAKMFRAAESDIPPPEFSKNYLVWGDDPAVARAALTGGLAEFIAERRLDVLELDGPTLCLFRSGERIDPRTLKDRLDLLIDARELLPPELFPENRRTALP